MVDILHMCAEEQECYASLLHKQIRPLHGTLLHRPAELKSYITRLLKINTKV